MLKACAGDGRGILLIQSCDEIAEAHLQASAEALSAFRDGSVYLEKYIFSARHVELQMLSDEHGNVVCLEERDCSLQRRNQKLIEEPPAVHREDMLEFLPDSAGCFWFMEMNVLLQMKHCVTEMLIGYELVKWQIHIATGMRRPSNAASTRSAAAR